MRYPIAIEPSYETHAFVVVVPDLPGCFSAGDTLDEAIDNAKEGIELWLETVIDDGGSVPQPKPISEHQVDPVLAGWIWAVVTIDLAELSDKTERVKKIMGGIADIEAGRVVDDEVIKTWIDSLPRKGNFTV